MPLGHALRAAANVGRSFSRQPAPPIAPAPQEPEKDWTVLVYLEGRDRLAYSTVAALNKMEQVGTTEHVNVVAQATVVPTLTERTYPGLHPQNTRRYLIQKDADAGQVSSPILADLGAQQRLDQASLGDFLAWGMKQFPAKHYLVVVKKHGAGYARIGERVPLSARELQGALKQARQATGQGVDVLAFDSCSMGQIEVAHQLRNEVKVMTASPEDVYAIDFPYPQVLADLNEHAADATPQTLGQAIVQEQMKVRPGGIHTALDLQKTQAFAGAMGRLSDALVDAKAPRNRIYTAMMTAASVEPRESLRFNFNFRDLGGFLEALQADPALAGMPAVQEPLQEARRALRETVVAHAVNPKKDHARHSTGATAVLPWELPRQAVREGYLQLDYARDSHWARLMDYLFAGAPQPVEPPPTAHLGPARTALKGYKQFIAPFLGVHCPYTPSCSQYTREAIETHGLIEGAKLGLMRLISCDGKGPEAGGADPVPGVSQTYQDPAPALLDPPAATDKSDRRVRFESTALAAARAAGKLLGGMTGMAIALPVGLAFGAFVGWKAGTATIDVFTRKLLPRFRHHSVAALVQMEKPLGVAGFKLNKKVQQATGSARLAALVAGPTGTLVGALAGAAGGAGVGWGYGSKFAALFAENATKKAFGELPQDPLTRAILDRDYR